MINLTKKITLLGILQRFCLKVSGDLFYRTPPFSRTLRSSHSEVFLGVLCNFIKITLWHGCSPANLLHIFGTPFFKNTSGWLPLNTHYKTTCRVLVQLHKLYGIKFLKNIGISPLFTAAIYLLKVNTRNTRIR